MGLEECLSVSHPTLELKRVRTLWLPVFSSSGKQRGAGPGTEGDVAVLTSQLRPGAALPSAGRCPAWNVSGGCK